MRQAMRLVGQLALGVLFFASVTTCPARDRWTEAEAWSWYSDQPRLFGANYVMTYAATPTEMWQADAGTPGANTFDMAAIENELDIAQQTGFNTLRVTLSYEVWRDDRAGFMDRLDQFVTAADARGIRPSFIFWDDVNFTTNPDVPTRQPYLGEQADPVPGMHNSQWTGTGGLAVHENPGNWTLPPTDPSPGSGSRDYVQDIVGAYATDDRVLMWNAYNEPVNGGQSLDSTNQLIHATAEWAREVNPVQPISFDMWGTAADTASLAESDVVSFHIYAGPEATIREVAAVADRTKRPVFLTEWMARTYGSTLPDILPELMDRGVAAYNWGLVNGDQQTQWPWGSPPQTDTTEPSLWFHDLYRRDGTAYLSSEIEMYQHYRLRDDVLRSVDSRMVEVQNPGFEDNDLGGVPDAHTDRVFDGWTVTRDPGGWVGGTIVPDTWHFNEQVPEGDQAMFALDIEVGQQLAETLAAETFYVLEVAIGHRVDRVLPDYDFSLLAGGVELTPLTEAFSNPIEGAWTDASRIYRVEAGDVLVGLPLEIRLSSAGAETFFDDVRLIAVESLQPIGVTSDLDMDGEITRADWLIFAAHTYADLSGMTPAGRFLAGDLDGDGDNDYRDFLIFKSDFVAAHGVEAFGLMLRVPEPSSVALIAFAFLTVRTRHDRR
ncbi:cellulase family glycosylhydrolase [Botrimarina colliarenosi]|uniref:cellulase family glycosylhydrolase n=1 Tax=Botrimarina colliarenosi TaxID=2528001 RepID=UPI0011B6B261|nr:cellulase family glycosylhydrolase [Botrimarina colliarenosi]